MRHIEPFEVRADRDIRRRGVTLWVQFNAPQEMPRLLTWSGAVVSSDPGVMFDAPPLLTDTAAQQLMDDLWRAGLRPTEGAGSAGSLAATQKHLDHISRILDGVLPRALRLEEE